MNVLSTDERVTQHEGPETSAGMTSSRREIDVRGIVAELLDARGISIQLQPGTREKAIDVFSAELLEYLRAIVRTAADRAIVGHLLRLKDRDRNGKPIR
jgi:hypothetical protein